MSRESVEALRELKARQREDARELRDRHINLRNEMRDRHRQVREQMRNAGAAERAILKAQLDRESEQLNESCARERADMLQRHERQIAALQAQFSESGTA